MNTSSDRSAQIGVFEAVARRAFGRRHSTDTGRRFSKVQDLSVEAKAELHVVGVVFSRLAAEASGTSDVQRSPGPTNRSCTSQQWVYEMSLPRGYDTSKFLQELVLLKSTDSMKSWNVVSRGTVTANGGSFGQALTPDGTLHRFVWACYSRDPKTKTSDIYRISRDEGKTWTAGPTFVSDRFAWYPHRLRTLRDGTLVPSAAAEPNGAKEPMIRFAQPRPSMSSATWK